MIYYNIMNTNNYNFFDDNNQKLISDVNKFLPKVEKKWSYADECNSCGTIFGNLYNRQHHCRSCGRSFCWNCCHNTIYIPVDIVESPEEEKTYKKKINEIMKYMYNNSLIENSKKVVCNNCHSKLLMLNKIRTYICILGYCDYKSLFKFMGVSKIPRLQARAGA